MDITLQLFELSSGQPGPARFFFAFVYEFILRKGSNRVWFYRIGPIRISNFGSVGAGAGSVRILDLSSRVGFLFKFQIESGF